MLPIALANSLETVNFNDIINFIDDNYNFTPTKFLNGEILNEINQNNGSCKVFSFAKLHNLTNNETLLLFGEFYRIDVLQNPNGTDHQNIRNFMKYGWEGISFEGLALIEK